MRQATRVSMRLGLVAALMVLAGCASRPDSGGGRDLTLATWNIGWLTERAADITRDNPDLRHGIPQRSSEDFDRLRRYADQLGADVIAIEEIDGEKAARRVFPASQYDVVLTDETDLQRPGFAIRKGIRWTRNPDLAALDIIPNEKRSLRRGADITLHLPQGDVRLLAVHLKSGCFNVKSTGESCTQLQQQIPILAGWIDQRRKEGVPFAVLGDFNRRLRSDDPVWQRLNDSPSKLTMVTEGRKSTCWGGQYPDFIDQILLGGSLVAGYVPDSFRVLVYEETDKALQDRISDHCPVSVKVAAPSAGPAVPAAAPVARADKVAESNLLNSTLWVQHSTEYRVTAEQTYAQASERLRVAVRAPRRGVAPEQTRDFQKLPAAVVVDIDETILDNSAYEGRLIRDGGSFAAATWDPWIAEARAIAVPGAVAYVNEATRLGVRVFYVTNRSCRARPASAEACPQIDETLRNLRAVGIKSVKADDLMLSGENGWHAEKAGRRADVAKRYWIAQLVGDQLTDFLPELNNKPETERRAAAEAASRHWGNDWFLLANPMYGGWETAIPQPRIAQVRIN